MRTERMGDDAQDKSVSKKLRLLVSGALLVWLAWRTDWNQVGAAFLHLRVEFWLAAAALLLLAQVASAVRWRLLAQPLGFHRPLRQFVGFYFVGMFFNLLLPTSVGGDVVRAWYLDGNSGRKLPAFLSVFVDRLSGLLILLAVACVADILCPIPLPFWIGASIWATAGCAVLGLVALPVVHHYVRPGQGRIGTHIVSLSHSLTLLFGQTRLLLITTALSLLVQVVNVVLLWLIGLAIDAPVPAGYCGIVVPMVTLLTLLPVSLNGMGVREGGMVLFLAPLGIGSATALTLAFLWFSLFVAVSLLGAAIYLFGTLSQSGERTHDSFVGRDSDQGRARQPQAAA
ncbi:MAG TPA: lysylphosphatidylglycerol synthase transmembrane domain-containing protein [Gemmataceae bacterium]|nr:lysylphosphatidylglycerol synthase transmembrane domain-containing protein [Gemmataceae bacterium]